MLTGGRMSHRKYPVRFITFTGRPGSGKSEIIKRLIEVTPRLEMFRGQSVTTRAFRKGDVTGEYLHVTENRFDELLKLGEFLWTFNHGGYRLGTKKEDVDAALNREDEKVSVMTLVPEAVTRLRAFVGRERVVSFFVETPDHDEIERMIKRGDSPEKAEGRLEETESWNIERMKQLGVDAFLVQNRTEHPPCHSALTFIEYQLKRLAV